jgi:hypothetical protein
VGNQVIAIGVLAPTENFSGGIGSAGLVTTGRDGVERKYRPRLSGSVIPAPNQQQEQTRRKTDAFRHACGGGKEKVEAAGT